MIGEADASRPRPGPRGHRGRSSPWPSSRLGLREIYLEVIPSNVRAIRVYEACGFEVTGSTEKALRMSKRAAA